MNPAEDHPRLVSADRPDWDLAAACRNEDVRLFYPSDDERGVFARLRVARAKAVCSHCPVTRSCLDKAVSTRERYGIWGGLTPDERDALKS